MSAQTRHEVREAERAVIAAARRASEDDRADAEIVRTVIRLREAEYADKKSDCLPLEFHVLKRGSWGLALVSVKGKPNWRRGLGARWSRADAERYAEAFGGRTEVAF